MTRINNMIERTFTTNLQTSGCSQTINPSSKILYFSDNNSSLPQFRPSSNNCKNRLEHYSDSKYVEYSLKTDNFREKKQCFVIY